MIYQEYTAQELRDFIKYYNESLLKVEMILDIADSCYNASLIFAGVDDVDAKEIADQYSKLAKVFIGDAYNFTAVETEITGDSSYE